MTRDIFLIYFKVLRQRTLTGQDEDKGRIERNVGQKAQVVERVFLSPSPNADGQDAQPQKLE